MKFAKECITVKTEFDPKFTPENRSEKMLKYFADDIKKLKVIYHKQFHRFDKTYDDLIVAKCHKSLQEIEFKNPDRFAMHGIQKPFEMVKVVSFVGGSICEIISDFGKWFPVAQTLRIIARTYETYHDEIKIKNYPALQHFVILRKSLNSAVYEPVFESIIEKNPQLRSFYNAFEIHPVDEVDDNDWDPNDQSAVFEVEETLMNAKFPNLENLRLKFIGDTFLVGLR